VGREEITRHVGGHRVSHGPDACNRRAAGALPTSLIIAPWTRAQDDEGRARLKSVDRLAGLFVVNDSFAIPVGLAARGAVGRLGTGQAAPFRSNATGQESVSPTRVGAGGSRTEEEA
jgi:hypothetical protein